MERLFVLMFFFTGACLSNKNNGDSNDTSSSQVTTTQTTLTESGEDEEAVASNASFTTTSNISKGTNVDTFRNPFGVLISAGPGNNTNPKVRLKAFKAIAPPYVRHGITLSSWDGSNAFYESLVENGFKVVLNITNSPQNGTPQPFPTDLEKYRTKLNEVLTKYKPEVLVVENEEYNLNYHTGSMKQYLDELKVAIEVAHSKGIKVTNGGLTSRHMTLMVWKDYMDRGMKKEAGDFARRTIPQNIINDLPSLAKHQPLKNAMNAFDTLLNAYKTMDIDYVNFHWYEPILLRFNNNKQGVNIDTNRLELRAMEEVVTFLRRKTGKDVMTNELGQVTKSKQAVIDVLRKAYELKMPYVIWYSGDGQGKSDAVALTNYDGTLRENGEAFREFIKNYLNSNK